VYVGYWSFGKAKGQGEFHLPTGEQYKGGWSRDKALGQISPNELRTNGYMWLISKERKTDEAPIETLTSDKRQNSN
jgi:hypothetical protein